MTSSLLQPWQRKHFALETDFQPERNSFHLWGFGFLLAANQKYFSERWKKNGRASAIMFTAKHHTYIMLQDNRVPGVYLSGRKGYTHIQSCYLFVRWCSMLAARFSPLSFQGWRTPSSSGSSFRQGFWSARRRNPVKYKETQTTNQHRAEQNRNTPNTVWMNTNNDL